MEFTPFDGELDKEPMGSFIPFTGKLDDPSAPVSGGKELDTLGDKSLGLLEAGAGMVAGMPAQIAGGLYGLGALVSGQGLDEAANRVKRVQESNFGMGAFKPITKKGQEYSEKAGELLEKPLGWAEAGGRAVGGELGATNARVAAETVLNFMPLHFGVKGMGKIDKVVRDSLESKPKHESPAANVDDLIAKKTEVKAEELVGEKLPPPTNENPPIVVTREGVAIPADKADTALYAREQQMDTMREQLDQEQVVAAREERPHNVSNDETGQADLFTENTPNPYTSEGHWQVDENGMPIRADLSMEAANLENPLQRNLWGDELGPSLEQGRSLTEALDTLEQTPFKGDARDVALEALGAPTGARSFNERTRGQGGAVSEDISKQMAKLGVSIVRTDRGFQAVNAEDKIVGRLESNITPEQGTMLRERFPNEASNASVDIVKVDDSLRGQGVGTALYAEWAKAHGGNVAPSGVTSQPAWNQWKRNYPAQVDSFVKGEAQRLKDGANPEQVFSNIKDQTIADRVRIEAYEPGQRDPFHKQRGHIRVPGEAQDQLKRIPGFKKNIDTLLPDRSTNEQFVEKNLNTSDVDQNWAQKGVNYLTKGGDYMTQKTQNPLIKRVVDRFKEAEDIAAANKQNIVHEIYTKTLRGLDKKDFMEVWSALKQMELAKVKLTDAELMQAGFNGKARDAIKMHQEIMDSMVGKINESLDAAGLTHINPEAAYVAAKATGNFRRVMMKEIDGELRVVGAIGARTRQGLAKQVGEFQKLYPDTVPGEQQVYRGNNMKSTGFDDMMSFLSSQDPLVAEFIQRSRELSYRGSKTHMMEKKGVVGMDGNKPWEDNFTNAKEGFEAQVRYLNTMLDWAEKSKANAEVGPLLDTPSLNMPNAKAYAERYRDMALGRNPTAAGKGIETMLQGITDSTDGWSSYVGDAAHTIKKITNAKLLLLNPGYYFTNFTQPFRTMPELAAFVNLKGGKTEVAGMGNMMRGMLEAVNPNPKGVYREALQYADSHHVYASDLLEDSNAVRQSIGHVLNTASQKPAAMLEQSTRKMMYMGFVDMMHKNGITPDEGLFQAAHKLTDMGMNRYTAQDAPLAVGAAGPVGRLPYNLMSYKFNELSRFAMLAREAIRSPADVKAYKPVLTALIAQVAFAGVMGTIGFKEADAIVRMVSDLMDKPTSLTQMIMDNGDRKVVGPVTVKDLAYGGVSSATQMDFSNRMGMGPILGDVENPANLVMPGATAFGKMVSSTAKAVSSPSETNVKRFVIDAIPGGQLLERQLFAKENAQGVEMGMNRNNMQAQPRRNAMDVFAKQMGLTGLNESRAKGGLYENQRVEMRLAEKQQGVISKMKDEMFEDGKIKKSTIDKYIKVEGNIETLDKQLNQMVLDQNLPSDIRDKIKASAVQGLPGVGKMKRRFH